MGLFDGIIDVIENLFGVNGDKWVKRKNISILNLESCNGETVDDFSTNTCKLCVALNDTIFRNNNKPLYYHMKCKCRNLKTELNNVDLIFPIEKITKYLFVNEDKSAMMRSMGYRIEDYNEIYNLISQNIRNEFLNNKYILGTLNNHGQHFEIRYTILGKLDKMNKKYLCHTGCVAYPNGKIKIATPLILDKEEK